MNKYNDKGEPHGPWKYYHNGKLWYKVNYINGKINGLCEDYYFKGQLSLKFNVINGNRHGICEEYWENGKLNIKEYFI